MMRLPIRGMQPLEVHLNPHEVVGYQACEKCHAAEISVWKQTPHYATFMTLHRRPEANQIASKLGISSFKNDSACTKCHYTMQANPSGLEAISGVSCESCHGAAKNWLDVHNDYGGPGVTRESESRAHRVERLRNSIAGGMRQSNQRLLGSSELLPLSHRARRETGKRGRS